VQHEDHTVSVIVAIECVNIQAAINVPRVPLDSASLMEEDADAPTLDATRGPETNSFAQRKFLGCYSLAIGR
jgi:hypothetical protein